MCSKNITGGASICDRPLYGNIVTFEPTHLIVLLTNHKPEINVSESLTRRLVLIPFLAEFKDPNKINKNNKYHILKDKDLEFKLSDKLDELLVWLVKGSIKYFKDGLGEMLKNSGKVKNDFINENDDLNNFLTKVCKKDPNGFVYHNDLYSDFKK